MHASFTYKNHRGETAKRRVVPQAIMFGATAWHPIPQWLLVAWDADKNAQRYFAMKDISHWEAE